MVPCASHFTLRNFFASAWNTSMNSRPMILRLASGSVTPARAVRKRAEASTRSTLTPRCFEKVSITCPASFRRSRPVSTNTQVSWSPIARWMSAAARKAKKDFLATDGVANFLHRLGDVVGHVPVVAAAADLVHEAIEDRTALAGVRHLRVELHAVEATRLVG